MKKATISNNKTLNNWNGNDSHRTFSILITSFWSLFNFTVHLLELVFISYWNPSQSQCFEFAKIAKDSSVCPFIHLRCAHCFWWWKTISWIKDSVDIHHWNNYSFGVRFHCHLLVFVLYYVRNWQKKNEKMKKKEPNKIKDERIQSFGSVMIRNFEK